MKDNIYEPLGTGINLEALEKRLCSICKTKMRDGIAKKDRWHSVIHKVQKMGVHSTGRNIENCFLCGKKTRYY